MPLRAKERPGEWNFDFGKMDIGVGRAVSGVFDKGSFSETQENRK